MTVFQPKRREIRRSKVGSGSSGIAQLLAASLSQNRQQNIGSSITDVQSQIKEAYPEGVPPGSSLNVGGQSTTANLPLNREFTESEANVISGSDKFEELVSDVRNQIRSNVLGADPVKRSYNQFLAEGGGSWLRRGLTPDDSELERLASNMVELQKYAFSEGGKNLTPTELQVVKAGLSLFGKGNNAIERDLSSAIDVLRRKKSVILGGSSSIKQSASPIPGSPGYQASGNNSEDSNLDDELRSLYLTGQ